MTEHDYTRLKAYHTNRRHGDNVADCGDCAVGKCEVPDLVDALAEAHAQRAAAEQRAERLAEAVRMMMAWGCLVDEGNPTMEDAEASGAISAFLFEQRYGFGDMAVLRAKVFAALAPPTASAAGGGEAG